MKGRHGYYAALAATGLIAGIVNPHVYSALNAAVDSALMFALLREALK